MKLTIFGDEFIGPRLVVSVDLDGGFRQSEPSVESDSLNQHPFMVVSCMKYHLLLLSLCVIFRRTHDRTVQ